MIPDPLGKHCVPHERERRKSRDVTIHNVSCESAVFQERDCTREVNTEMVPDLQWNHSSSSLTSEPRVRWAAGVKEVRSHDAETVPASHGDSDMIDSGPDYQGHASALTPP